MPDILELFGQKTVLDYMKERQYQTYGIGEALFPEVKHDTLEFEYLVGANELPVIAKVHSFDTEAEIGSLEAAKQVLEAAYIKKKYQITEKDLIALQFPRTAQEQQFLMQRVFNLIDKAANDVRARVELMRMQALTTGELKLALNTANSTSPTVTVDYGVPTDHKEALAGTDQWGTGSEDILGDLERWSGALDITPTRALTSKKIAGLILRNPKIIGYLYGAGSARVANLADLNAFFAQQGLPTIAVYEANSNTKYREQNADGTYTTKSYFPDNKFVMFGDGPLGESLYGPTPEESRLIRSASDVEMSTIGKVIGMVYEEGKDPVSTWAKAAATAIPSFPEAQNVFQAQPIA
ncbi:head protein [Lysinibacillus sp. FJAT-14745]|uniref:major capsid protein n=1 Tax=Lysinibacillus sp. FJAT-14745 TaxID=1704289 RepID=UPI0006ABA53B|nr:major capsid protein [Lysinibacillus sp. FJAT-14745]KOP78652.1 head protein [Lysinibacillus sp. FJAT-14745]